ncbi:hypothetical protein [uncultured Ruthenibacterium sp.]|uniref:hypothetical protein n=1 Tax=uncultured Ruthenibacterium sp. TaxID=1905347 RepID=UPI00349E8FFB
MKRKSWTKRHPRCAILATGILAFVISALPLLILHLADIPLFQGSRTRVWHSAEILRAGDEDYYLIRALREREKLQTEGPDGDLYVQGGELEMEPYEGASLIFRYVEDLVQAGVFREEWIDWIPINPDFVSAWMADTVAEKDISFTYTGDTAGFITLNAFAFVPSYGLEYYYASVIIESRTGKVVSLNLPIFGEVFSEMSPKEMLEKYIDYLDLSGFEDWEEVNYNVGTVGSALYSKQAQTIVVCNSYSYEEESGMNKVDLTVFPLDQEMLEWQLESWGE